MGGECCKPKDPLNNNTEIAIKEVKTECMKNKRLPGKFYLKK